MRRTDGLNLLRKFMEFVSIEYVVLLLTVKAWLERLPDIIKDNEPCNQWNMDELGLFF